MIGKLFFRNFILFLLLFLIPLLTLGGISLWVSTRYVSKEIEYRETMLFSTGIDTVETALSEAEAISLNLSMRPSIMQKIATAFNQSDGDLSSGDYDAVSTVVDMLFATANSNPYIYSIYLYLPNTSRYFLNSRSGISHLHVVSDRQWFLSYLDEDAETLFWLETRAIPRYLSDPRPVSVFSIYRRVSGTRNSGEGVLVLNLQVDSINRVFDRLVQSGCFFVLDEQGNLVFSNNSPRSYPPELLQEIFQEPQDHFVQSIEDHDYLVNKQPSPRYEGWQYVSVLDRDVMYRLPNLIFRITAALLLLGCLVGGLIAYRVTLENTRYMKELFSMVEAAKNGWDLPEIRYRHSGVHRYILQNIVEAFRQNNTLNTELGEKTVRLQRLEFMALRAQMRPHFLYNTLETLNWKAMALTSGPNTVTEMIGYLSRILRYAMTDSVERIDIRQEVEMVRCYIAIQHIRYESLCEVRWKVDEEVLEARIIKFLLQPLVENCFQHSVEKNRRPLSIKIRIFPKENHLHLQITDNGNGICAQNLQTIHSQLESEVIHTERHIGLANTHRRIQLLYGREYGLRIRSHHGLGTKVFLMLPLEKSD